MLQKQVLKEKLTKQLSGLLEEKLGETKSKEIVGFAKQLFSTLAWEDLADRSLEDLYGLVLSNWNLVAHREVNEVKCTIFNPDYEQTGWQTTHTVVAIVTDNMPFLVDSVRMELNRAGLTTHLITHFPINIERDENHQITRIVQPQNLDGDNYSDAFIYLEIDRQTDETLIKQLNLSITSILGDVRAAVDDWQAMRKKAVQLTEEVVKASNYSADDISENKAFLEWIINNNFTFLGCQDYDLVREDGKKYLRKSAGSGLGILRDSRLNHAPIGEDLLTQKTSELTESEELLTISKSSVPSTVHRPAYMDFIAVKRFDDAGEIIGERRFLGLYTSIAYNSRPQFIPILRNKVTKVIARYGQPATSHAGKELLNILENYPRDELFQANDEELYLIATAILQIQERQQIKLLLREDVYGRFVSCLVLVPRDRYDTDLRKKFEDILKQTFSAGEIEFTTHLSESVLARTLYIVHLENNVIPEYDVNVIEQKLKDAARSWQDDFKDAMLDHYGEEEGNKLANQYKTAFSAPYQEHFSARTAVYDVKRIEDVLSAHQLAMSLYRPLEVDGGVLHFKLFHQDNIIPLTDVLPVLENMGLKVIGEHPYEIKVGQHIVWLHDFIMTSEKDAEYDPDEIREIFQEAFANLWYGMAENDGFNRLVLAAGLSWREIAVLRAYAKYLKQAGFTFSQNYIEEALTGNPHIARHLIELFSSIFSPDPRERSDEKALALKDEILAALDLVSNLDEDRILRRYLDIIQATIRTNYFQKTAEGLPKAYMSFKFDPTKIPDLPLPRPVYEIFVYSPRVEGVHLRGGKVARGGLRWSDRKEDFRTEILGLVKAQQVKNSVIVPVGAKGGFIAKSLPSDASREEVMNEVTACYSTFIRGLLSITDNLKGGKVIPPKDVIRLDDDDPYLVVAADKGTATFSDTANRIAEEYGFWLGDAFASGGSVGYDHKKMGITAKGAWESVKRHFRELGKNIQREPFTVVAVGDMSGDVFGNGMLLSRHIRLVGAFNHMHIFIDPTPDEKASFAERERLFRMPRSSWEDYDQSLISKGGGVFKRSAKSIELTPEIQKLLGLKQKSVEPNALIKALLIAEYDLLWNGGIGTYVKAESELNDHVGDRANDIVRVNGKDLCCKVVGEGGNLGLTQLGRVEFALNGGKMNTDFIDNSGGVDCSDHEVNIKILLNDLVTAGDMTDKQRKDLLMSLTDEVSDLVLRNNYKQSQALSIARKRARVRLEDHIRLIHDLERSGKLDRVLEGLPEDEELLERKVNNQALSTPEISVILAYSKNVLKEEIQSSALPEEPYFQRALSSAFPAILGEQHLTAMTNHRLRREIIATQVVNTMINEMGATFVQRLKDETGSEPAAIATAFFVARAIFDMEGIWLAIEALDNKVTVETQLTMMLEVMRIVRRATRWFLRNYRKGLNIESTINGFASAVETLAQSLETTLVNEDYQQLLARSEVYVNQGVPEKLAKKVAGLRDLFASLDIIKAAQSANVKVDDMAAIHFALGNKLKLRWVRDQIAAHTAMNHWESLATAAFRDDLDYQQSALSTAIASSTTTENGSVETSIDQWIEEHTSFVEQWYKLIGESSSSSSQEFAMFAVAVRELTDLVQLSRHQTVQ